MTTSDKEQELWRLARRLEFLRRELDGLKKDGAPESSVNFYQTLVDKAEYNFQLFANQQSVGKVIAIDETSSSGLLPADVVGNIRKIEAAFKATRIGELIEKLENELYDNFRYLLRQQLEQKREYETLLGGEGGLSLERAMERMSAIESEVFPSYNDLLTAVEELRSLLIELVCQYGGNPLN